jgi:hypothetical protein
MSDKEKEGWEESSFEKYKNLSARDVLEWMEEASRFLRALPKPEQNLRSREIQSKA